MESSTSYSGLICNHLEGCFTGQRKFKVSANSHQIASTDGMMQHWQNMCYSQQTNEDG